MDGENHGVYPMYKWMILGVFNPLFLETSTDRKFPHVTCHQQFFQDIQVINLIWKEPNYPPKSQSKNGPAQETGDPKQQFRTEANKKHKSYILPADFSNFCWGWEFFY